MKKILLIACIAPVFGFSQTNRVTIGDGDFLNPLIWNPIGIPASGDSLTINHALTLSTDVYYTAGQIKINNSGSLIEDAIDRSVWVNGGSLVNHGTYTSHLLWVSTGGYIINTGSMNAIDSMLVDADITNSGTASINDMWIAINGDFNNSGTLTNTDSLFNQGIFTNSGMAGVYDLANDEMATLTNSYSLQVTNNMHNQGLVSNSGVITVSNDFSNCNTQSLDGTINNAGVFCIGNDFLNCGGDVIAGTGNYYIGNLSTNLGIFSGTFTFNTPSGGLSLNTGTVAPTVNFGTGICDAGLTEGDLIELSVYPNPVQTSVFLSIKDVKYIVYDYTGKQVQEGTTEGYALDLSTLNDGVYLLHVEGAKIQRIVKK